MGFLSNKSFSSRPTVRAKQTTDNKIPKAVCIPGGPGCSLLSLNCFHLIVYVWFCIDGAVVLAEQC